MKVSIERQNMQRFFLWITNEHVTKQGVS